MTMIQETCVQTLRFLAADEVEKAKSGHPGFPLGTAPLMFTLWDKFMRYNPADPKWFNRDRFVLSPGHGSALLYAMLHLAGYEITIDDLKNFRQWGSKTPGHPEYGVTPGVDVSTGPLGHGFAGQAWLWQNVCWQLNTTSRTLRLSITTPTDWFPTAT